MNESRDVDGRGVVVLSPGGPRHEHAVPLLDAADVAREPQPAPLVAIHRVDALAPARLLDQLALTVALGWAGFGGVSCVVFGRSRGWRCHCGHARGRSWSAVRGRRPG